MEAKMNYEMQFFSSKEFDRPSRDGGAIKWYPLLSEELKIKLDLFRMQWGSPVIISGHPDAVGRSDNTRSQHNVDAWGEVLAVDVMPRGIDCQADAIDAMNLAIDCGFKGVGFYPHWGPMPGMHLDVRRDKNIGEPATWGGIKVEGKQKFVSITDAIQKIRKLTK